MATPVLVNRARAQALSGIVHLVCSWAQCWPRPFHAPCPGTCVWCEVEELFLPCMGAVAVGTGLPSSGAIVGTGRVTTLGGVRSVQHHPIIMPW